MLTSLMTIAVAATALAGTHPAEIDRQTVAQLDTEFQLATKNNDVATLDRILHPEFKLVVGSGKSFDRNVLLDQARSGKIHFEYQDEEPGTQSVVVTGDTAVVTALLRIKGTEEGEEPFDRTLWFSDTYVRTRLGWKYFFGQASLPISK
jgi:ketosteroid isomerase-like protein